MEIRGHAGLHFEQLDEPIAVDAGVDVFDVSFGTAGVAGPDAARNF